ncbi:MAG: hypothetical protein AAF715_24670 [Myxococcota bacterium]
MDLPHDFRDLLVELDLAGADFVVVGGYAVAFHGYPRATKDLDVFVRPTRENAARVYRGLAAFGALRWRMSIRNGGTPSCRTPS